MSDDVVRRDPPPFLGRGLRRKPSRSPRRRVGVVGVVIAIVEDDDDDDDDVRRRTTVLLPIDDPIREDARTRSSEIVLRG